MLGEIKRDIFFFFQLSRKDSAACPYSIRAAGQDESRLRAQGLRVVLEEHRRASYLQQPDDEVPDFGERTPLFLS